MQLKYTVCLSVHTWTFKRHTQSTPIDTVFIIPAARDRYISLVCAHTHTLFLLLWLRAWWTDRQAEGIWYSVSGWVDCLILEAAWWGAFSASASQLGLQSTKLMANKIVCLCPSHVGPTRRELSLSSGINEQKRREEEEGGWGGNSRILPVWQTS